MWSSSECSGDVVGQTRRSTATDTSLARLLTTIKCDGPRKVTKCALRFAHEPSLLFQSIFRPDGRGGVRGDPRFRPRKQRAALSGHYSNLIFTRIQEEPLGGIAEFIGVAVELAVEIHRRKFVRAYDTQSAKWRLGFRQGLEFLPNIRQLALADLDRSGKFLVPGINKLEVMLAGSEGIFARDTEICRRPQVLAIHKDACPAWIDVCFEIPDALPEGPVAQEQSRL